jgi:hypothetical protein
MYIPMDDISVEKVERVRQWMKIQEATHHISSVEKHPISGIKKEFLIKSVHSRHSQNFRHFLLSQH